MPKGVEQHRMHRSPDDLDGLLRAYFRQEMPDPWPRAPGTPPARRPVVPPWQQFHRHLALAAAVSFFLVGSFLLTWGFPDGKQEPGPVLTRPGKETGDKSKRPHSADPGKALDQQPDHKDPPAVLMPTETIPLNGRQIRSSGVKTRHEAHYFAERLP